MTPIPHPLALTEAAAVAAVAQDEPIGATVAHPADDVFGIDVPQGAAVRPPQHAGGRPLRVVLAPPLDAEVPTVFRIGPPGERDEARLVPRLVPLGDVPDPLDDLLPVGELARRRLGQRFRHLMHARPNQPAVVSGHGAFLPTSALLPAEASQVRGLRGAEADLVYLTVAAGVAKAPVGVLADPR